MRTSGREDAWVQIRESKDAEASCSSCERAGLRRKAVWSCYEYGWGVKVQTGRMVLIM